MEKTPEPFATPLGRYLADPEPTEAQLAAEWARISQRLPGERAHVSPRARRSRFIFALATVGALILGVKTYWPTRDKPTHQATVLVTTGPATRTLTDGSQVTIVEGGRIRTVEGRPNFMQVSVEAGEALFDVTHRPDRSFLVSAADVEVRVVGTQFRVALEPRPAPGKPWVRVSVTRGIVEASRISEPVQLRLTAGDAHLFADAAAKTIAADLVAPSPPADARALFEQANKIRRDGRGAEAARLYDALLVKFPSDPRAGLAALELGRLRMDTLNDLRGASDALRRAIRTIPNGSLNEDAHARLVDAMDGLHDRVECRRARADYLGLYPKGVHAIAVSARCK